MDRPFQAGHAARRFSLFLVLALGLGTALPPRAEPADLADDGGKPLTIYIGPGSPLKEVLGALAVEVFRRIDKPVHFIETGSAQRALALANERGDGDSMRIADIHRVAPKNTTNLLLIPEPIFRIEFFVYTKHRDLEVSGWGSLEGMRNGFRVGTKILEKNVPGERTILADSKRLFRMLDAGRLDTVIEHGIIGDLLVERLGLKGITKQEPAVFSVPGHLLLHRKHQELIPFLSTALEQMKADGTYASILAEALQAAPSP